MTGLAPLDGVGEGGHGMNNMVSSRKQKGKHHTGEMQMIALVTSVLQLCTISLDAMYPTGCYGLLVSHTIE